MEAYNLAGRTVALAAAPPFWWRTAVSQIELSGHIQSALDAATVPTSGLRIATMHAGDDHGCGGEPPGDLAGGSGGGVRKPERRHHVCLIRRGAARASAQWDGRT